MCSVGVLTRNINGVKIPNDVMKDDNRIIWKVRLFKDEKSKNGNFSSCALFLSLILRFCDLR